MHRTPMCEAGEDGAGLLGTQAAIEHPHWSLGSMNQLGLALAWLGRGGRPGRTPGPPLCCDKIVQNMASNGHSLDGPA